MARKRKELPVLEGVKITDVAAEGNALARVDDMVVFIPFGAPGDVADIKLDKKKKSYAEGHIERLIEPSPVRETVDSFHGVSISVYVADAVGNICLTPYSCSANSNR